MIRPRWQKALVDVFGNLVRSMLVIASIMVGLFAVGIIASLYANLLTAMRDGYASTNPANVMVRTDFFDDALVKRITRLAGVDHAEGILSTDVRIRKDDGDWVPVTLAAARNFNELKINRVVLKAGSWPPGDDEIVFDQNKLDDLGASVGDMVTMEVSPGDTREFRVVGIVQDQTIGAFSLGGGYFVASLQGYLDADNLAYLNLPNAYNILYVTAEDGQNESAVTQVLETVRDELEDNHYNIYTLHWRLSNDHPNMTYVDALSGILFLLGFLVVFLSGFLITNTFSALLKQQTTQIGIMKTVGARTYQVIGIYMMVIFLYSLVAYAIAVPLSFFASSRLMQFLSSNINIILQGEHVSSFAIGLQTVIALVVPQVAGFFPILRGARMPVQAALSGLDNPAQGRAGKPRQRLRVKGLPRPLLISLRNVFRRKSRLILTLITLSLGGAVFIATFNVRASLEVFVEKLMRYFSSDVNLTLDRDYRVEEINRILMALPDVQHVEAWVGTTGEIILEDGSKGENFRILAPPSTSTLVVPMMISGRWIVPGDENAITLNERFLTLYPQIKVGDKIQIEIRDDITEWVVVGFFQLAGKSGGTIAYTSSEYLSEITGQVNRSNIYRILSSRPNLTLEEQEELAVLIESTLDAQGVHVADSEAGASLNTSTARGLDVLTTFLLIMAGLTALVGSIGLTGTMSLSVLERTREIGVMRAIGASDGSLFRLVMVEGVIIGLISWVVGSLLSFPISGAISGTINAAIFDAATAFTWKVDGFVIWLGVVVVLAVVASIIPARSATRLTIREVLSYE